MVRILYKLDSEIQKELNLDKETSHYISTVLKMRVGEEIVLFDGKNIFEYTAKIIKIHKNLVTVFLESKYEKSVESPIKIHLAQAISKGERMDFVIQKSVELGVTSITPLITQRVVVKLDQIRLEKKILHWQAIANFAAAQCGRTIVPEIKPSVSFANYIEKCTNANRFILSTKNGINLKKHTFVGADCSILIGPEGGFSEEEEIAAYENNFQNINLGPRVLRTETATLAAMTILQFYYGDM